MFYKLVVQNGDVGYNWVQHVIPGEKLYTAIHPRITDILITSDHDYDESHPAGTSLNNVFKAYYFSYTQFLGDVDHSDVDTHDQWLGYTEKPCNEIDKRELSVIDPYYFALYPMHRPTVWKDRHTITVTLTDENGVDHSASIEIDFDSL